MASVNKVILVGNLGADPETRYMPNGDAVTNIRVATTDRYKDKASGEMKEATEWHRINFFGKLAEIAGQYLRKGSSVYIEGRIRTRKWQDQSGQDRYSTEIIADQMQMLGSRQSGDGGNGGQQQRQGGQRQQGNSDAYRRAREGQPPRNAPDNGFSNGPGYDGMDDDIPFGPMNAARFAHAY